MDEEDYARLLQHTQRRMRDLGLADLMDRLVETMPAESTQPSEQLLQMLEGLETELRLQDGAMARMVVDRIGEVARTAEGGRIDGLWVELAPAHRDLYGVDGVDLTRGHDLTPMVEMLRRLRGELNEGRWRGE